jgi:ABC-type antimicrobial peptide transport system, permease component
MANAQFCNTYLALGMSWQQIRSRLVRNILTVMRPIIARMCLAVMLGSIFGEVMFGINGFGAWFFSALRDGDLAVVRVWTQIVGSLVLIVNVFERHAACEARTII